MNEVKIWRMGQYYKVYSEDTTLIRQLANAEDCKVGSTYYKRGLVYGLDAILPFKAKFGRRIFRVLAKKGFNTPSKWPNLAQDGVLTLERVPMASKVEGGLGMAEKGIEWPVK